MRATCLTVVLAACGGGDSFAPSADIRDSHPWLLTSRWSGVIQDGTPNGSLFAIEAEAFTLWSDPGTATARVHWPDPLPYGTMAVQVGGSTIRGKVTQDYSLTERPLYATIAADRGSISGTLGGLPFWLSRDAGLPQSTLEVWVFEFR